MNADLILDAFEKIDDKYIIDKCVVSSSINGFDEVII